MGWPIRNPSREKEDGKFTKLPPRLLILLSRLFGIHRNKIPGLTLSLPHSNHTVFFSRLLQLTQPGKVSSSDHKIRPLTCDWSSQVQCNLEKRAGSNAPLVYFDTSRICFRIAGSKISMFSRTVFHDLL